MRAALLYLLFFVAAVLEVAGDAVVRRGLRGGGLLLIVLGFAMLGTYGIAVNLVPLDFARLLGAYVAIFAVTGVLVGRFVFRDMVPVSTWLGLSVIVLGGLIIQFGPTVAERFGRG